MRSSIDRHRLIRTVVVGFGIMALAAAATPAAAAQANTLPVFSVRQVGVTEQQAAELQRAFGLERLERSADGSVRYLDAEAFQHVPTLQGDTGVGEDGPTVASRLDFEALARITVLPADEATARTSRALRTAGLLPADAAASSDHTVLETVNSRGGSPTSTKLDTATSYSFTLDGVPYEGPGAKIRVSYDGAGKVTQLLHATRTVLKTDSVRVANLAMGAKRCAQKFPARAKVDAEYAYYAPPLDIRPQTLEPSFRCTGTTAEGAALQVTFVSAKADAPAPGGPSLSSAPTRTTTAPGSRAGISVGSEGTGVCSGLDYTGQNLNTFNNKFANSGVPVEFSWLDADAWEDDFKDPAFGGNDTTWTDSVDMAYWQGHGSPDAFSFSGCSNTDDTSMHRNDARWGNTDVEWMSLFTCLILKGVSGDLAWWQRWGAAFHGLHQINSFDTVSNHSSKHGGIYASYLMDSNLRVRTAWALASIDDQPSDVKYASMGPVGPGGMVNINDHFHGQGTIGPDVSAADLTGWWYLRGSS